MTETDLEDYYGMLSEEAADELEQVIEEQRRRHDGESERRTDELVRALESSDR